MFDNKDKPVTTKEDKKAEEKLPKALPKLGPEPKNPIPKATAPTRKLSDMEAKLLKDIKREFQNVARTRYAHAIDLRIWMGQHNYPDDFIEAACSL